MPRPRKDGLDYFPHDTDAVNDEKIESLRALYGNDGYAFYFIMLERIYRANNQEIDLSDEELRQVYSKKVDVSLEKFDKMLATALKQGCFDKVRYETDGVLTSNGIKKRAAVVTDKREKMRAAYEEKKDSAAETKQKKSRKKAETKKKQSKNESEKKEPAETDLALDHYIGKYKAIYGFEPEISYGRDKKLLKDLIGSHGLERVKRIIDVYLSDNDNFVTEAAHEIPVMKSRVNRYLKQVNQQPMGYGSDFLERQREEKLKAVGADQ